MKIPLYGVPKSLWELVTGQFSAGPGLILWRAFLLAAAVIGSGSVISLTGGGGVVVIVMWFALTTVLSYALRDDILAIWSDLWNAEWGEAEI